MAMEVLISSTSKKHLDLPSSVVHGSRISSSDICASTGEVEDCIKVETFPLESSALRYTIVVLQ